LRCGRDERKRLRVLSWLAALEDRPRIWTMSRGRVVLVSRQTVLVLGMLVRFVDVRVQKSHQA